MPPEPFPAKASGAIRPMHVLTDFICHQLKQFRFVLYMPVQGGSLNAEGIGQFPHAQSVQARLV